MSVDYLSVGFTVDPSRLTDEPTGLLMIDRFLPDILAQIESIDYGGYFMDESGLALRQILSTALDWVRTGAGDAAWPIPSTELVFRTAGGWSWGDSPFDEYDAVNFLIEAVDQIPLFGHAVGILGSGIRTEYPK